MWGAGSWRRLTGACSYFAFLIRESTHTLKVVRWVKTPCSECDSLTPEQATRASSAVGRALGAELGVDTYQTGQLWRLPQRLQLLGYLPLQR